MADMAGKARGSKKRRRRRTGGQGAARPRQKPRRESTIAIIDRLLLSPVQTSLNGKVTRVTILAAIMYQLLQKELAGDPRAGRALLKYEELARHGVDNRLELEFIDSDYTRSLAEDQPECRHD
jgi:hypothetical protein